MAKSLRYPDKAIDEGIQAVAQVSFIVNTDCSFQDFKMVDDPGFELKTEAKTILEEGPRQEAGSPNGRVLRCRVPQTITFRLE